MPRRRAFTLIELLVVIAIIGMLISILLPALGQARKTARQLKCSTNIRSMVQAFILFAHNHQDTYPLPSVPRTPTRSATSYREVDSTDLERRSAGGNDHCSS